jgi:uncharacterized protein (DUF3820 family)
VFTDTEEKLIRLALDEAAQPGEIRNSAVKLLESLRRHGMRPEALILGTQLQAQSLPETTLITAGRRVMPFGKHKGRQLEAIEASYLRWVLRECSCVSLGLREAIQLVLSAGGTR